jgi:nucleotide-binding universal stress UspA family protein
MKIDHVLLPTDLSPEALRAFRPVEELARSAGARITLLHVIHVLTPTSQGEHLAAASAAGGAGDRKTAVQALEEQAAKLASDLEVELDVVTSDRVAQAIADYADEHGCSLIALSTHGRSGFRRLALGSVAEGVIRHAHVPVLTFPRSE